MGTVVNSGMIYTKVDKMTERLGTKLGELNEVLDRLQNERCQAIRFNYSGEAADTSEKTIKEVSKRVNENVQKIIDDLKKEANIQQENYQKLDQKAKDELK